MAKDAEQYEAEMQASVEELTKHGHPILMSEDDVLLNFSHAYRNGWIDGSRAGSKRSIEGMAEIIDIHGRVHWLAGFCVGAVVSALLVTFLMWG